MGNWDGLMPPHARVVAQDNDGTGETSRPTSSVVLESPTESETTPWLFSPPGTPPLQPTEPPQVELQEIVTTPREDPQPESPIPMGSRTKEPTKKKRSYLEYFRSKFLRFLGSGR